MSSIEANSICTRAPRSVPMSDHGRFEEGHSYKRANAGYFAPEALAQLDDSCNGIDLRGEAQRVCSDANTN